MDLEYNYTYFTGEEPDFDRVLFLGVDGVLNSESYFRDNPDVLRTLRTVENPGQLNNPETLLDPRAVDVLDEAVEAVEPTVVLTAVWRKHYTLSEAESFLRERGYSGTLEASVQEGDQIDPSRNEIILWSEEETDPENFLVLDSRDLRGIENQILVDSSSGLTPDDGHRIVDHFAGDQ